MSVSDSHCNAPSEFSDTNKCREEEIPQTQALASPDEGSTKKKKRRKKRTEESNVVEVCPKPLVDTVIPIVSSEEKAETITQNPSPIAHKKKKKNAQGAQPFDPSLSIGLESDVSKKAEAGQSDANWNGDLCPKPLLGTPIPIVPQEENAGTTAQNPIPKKKKKSVQGAQPCDPSVPIGDVTEEEGARQIDANFNGDICSEPLLDTPIPIVEQDGSAGTAIQNPNPTPQKKKKKKKKKSVQGAQACEPSIPTGDVTKEEGAQQIDTNSNGGICSKPLLDTPIPIVEQDEDAGTTIQNPNPTPQKKKKKKSVQGAQTCDPSIPITAEPVEPSISKDEGATSHATPVDPEQMTKKKMKRENALKSEGLESPKHNADSTTETPFQKTEDSAPSIDPTIPTSQGTPVDPEQMTKKEKKRKSYLQNEGLESEKHNADPTTETPVQKTECSAPSTDPTIPTSQATAVDPEQTTKKKKKRKSYLKNEGLKSEKSNADPTTETTVQKTEVSSPSIDPTVLTSQATPVDPEQMTKKNKIKKSALKNEGLESEKHNADPTTETPVQKTEDSAPSIHPTIPTSQATPVDPEQMAKKKKKRNSALKNEGLESEKHNADPTTETTVQKTEDSSPSIDPTVPTSQATAVDPEQMTKKKKIRKNALENEGLESDKHNADPTTETPVQKTEGSAPSTDPTIPTSQATPVDPVQVTKKKKKRKSALKNEGLESEKHNADPTTETPVQKIEDSSPSIDPTVPTSQATLVVDPEHMTKKKNIRKSALKNEGLESEKHNTDPNSETPVQKTEESSPSTDPIVPTSQATLVNPEHKTEKKKKRKSELKNEGLESEKHNADPTTEQMTKKKMKIRKCTLKNEGLESEKHNADPTSETPVQKTEGHTTENSTGGCNIGAAVKTMVRRTDSLGVTKSPFKQHGESSMRCRACRQLGHKFQQCPRLKCLSEDEEVCFFCGEIGHSLGKCSVSRTARVRFGKCLFCYEHGHFSYNCPRNGHGTDPKVVAANGAINITVEAKGEPLAGV